MTYLSTRLTAALTLAFALAAPLQAQIIVDPPRAAWTLSPENTKADEAFTLTALSYRYTCASAFANQSVSVADGRINLSFTSSIRPEVQCPANDVRPYGPAFRMPPLKAGKYAVSMHLLLPCHVAQPACKAAIPVEEAGTLVVRPEPEISYLVNPAQVAAGQDFSLSLQSTSFHCNTGFTYLASRVNDGRVTLTFLDKANPLILCVDDAKKLYGPTYRITGLKAGTYEVWAERLPFCFEDDCKMMPNYKLAGKLVVTETPIVRKGWFLKPREVKSGAAFTMNVVNNEYGNCNTGFEHASVVVQDNLIAVSFNIVSHPDRVCVVDLRPHGPAFQMSALKPGRYPLVVQVMPRCMFTEPRCMADFIDPRLQVPSDTLIVSQSLSLGGSPAPSGAGPAAWHRDGSMGLRLPAGAQGIWRAEVLNLSGRRLQSIPLLAGEGDFKVELASKPQRGVYLVRLVSPSRETHTLRVPVKD